MNWKKILELVWHRHRPPLEAESPPEAVEAFASAVLVGTIRAENPAADAFYAANEVAVNRATERLQMAFPAETVGEA